MKKSHLKEIVDIIEKEGLLKYGHVIPKIYIGDLFGCHDYDFGQYIYPLLELKSYIENVKGMYCKIRSGDLQIFPLNSATKCSKNRRKRSENIDKTNRNILQNIDTNNMNFTVKAEVILEKRLL